jgi:asparagine synthase (glutamine-hydrolysing)
MVDISLFRGVLPMLGKENSPTKHDLAATPAKPLPTAAHLRPKTGFAIPVREWIFDQDGQSGERGLRGWAKRIYGSFRVG